MISGDAIPSQVQRMMNLAARGYLTKPFNIQELLQLVEKSLSQKGVSRVPLALVWFSRWDAPFRGPITGWQLLQSVLVNAFLCLSGLLAKQAGSHRFVKRAREITFSPLESLQLPPCFCSPRNGPLCPADR